MILNGIYYFPKLNFIHHKTSEETQQPTVICLTADYKALREAGQQKESVPDLHSGIFLWYKIPLCGKILKTQKGIHTMTALKS